jgi:hypothetical protein
MCLINILTEDEQKKMLENDSESITVYKVAYNPYPHIYVSPYLCGLGRTNYDGTQEADDSTTIRTYEGDDYQAGFHFFLEKEAAVRLQQSIVAHREEYVVIPAIVRKEWITAIGKEHGHGIANSGKEIVIVTNKAIFN